MLGCVSTKYLGTVGEGAFVQRDGLAWPSGRQVRAGQVVAGGQRVRVRLTKYLLTVGEGAFVQRDGLIQPPGILVGAGQVVARGQGVRMGLAQDPLAVSDKWLAKLHGLGGTVAQFI